MHRSTPRSADAAPPRRVYKRVWQRNKRREDGVEEVVIAECGTVAAYRRHLRNIEDGDVFCTAAWNADSRRRRAVARLRRAETDLAAAVENGDDSAVAANRLNVTAAETAITAAETEMEAARLGAQRAKKTKNSRTNVA